jgi:hypothetical protein
MEKKMWTIFGGLAVISFLLSVPGQSLLRQLTNANDSANISAEIHYLA